MAAHPYSRIETACLEGRAQSTRFRQKQFQSLLAALKASEDKIKQAIVSDTDHNDTEVALEYALALYDLHLHYKSLDLEQDLKSQRALENLEATTNVGIVYVIPSSQNLFYSVLSVLTAAIAAGNCVILELPTTLTRVSGVLREMLPEALDADTFAITSSRPSDEFLSKCHVVQQSDNMQSPTATVANNHQPTPPAKTVAVVDRTADISAAALAIARASVAFSGLSAYRPDLVLVNEFVADEFIYHLVQSINSPTPRRRSPQSPSPFKALYDGDVRTLKEFEGVEGLKIIVQGHSGSVVEIKDRTKSPFGGRVQGRVILLSRITSLDDSIDLCNSFDTPLEASYVFADARSANYLSRFVNARVSCINHIPTELLVGPFAPNLPHVAPSPSPRYAPAYFRTPRPRIEHPSSVSQVDQQIARSGSTKDFDRWSKSIVDTPLPVVKQRDGKAIDFFDANLLLMASTLLSVLVASGLAWFRLNRRHA